MFLNIRNCATPNTKSTKKTTLNKRQNILWERVSYEMEKLKTPKKWDN